MPTDQMPQYSWARPDVCLGMQEGFRPAKFFSIDRVFRNEAVDRTHLAEFHQIEGRPCCSHCCRGMQSIRHRALTASMPIPDQLRLMLFPTVHDLRPRPHSAQQQPAMPPSPLHICHRRDLTHQAWPVL